MPKKHKNEAEHTAVATMEDAAPTPSKKERKAAKEAAKLAEKASAKAAEKAAREAARAEKDAAKAARKAAKQAEKAAKPHAFKHLRKKKLSSGKGATPREVGESLVALFNAGKADEAERTWYHRKIESIEADGSVFDGIKGVAEKSAWWTSNHTIVSAKAEGPFVCSTGFTVIFSMTVETKDGKRTDLRESGVYTVENGRIVREQFMY
ncbi:MAG: SnoaL-like domain-containing protein [Phycisphaerales bacterium]